MLSPDYRKITDIRVRQAIGYAYPYNDVPYTIEERVGVTSQTGTSILPPGFPGRQEYSVPASEPGHTAPTKAKALLQEAGFAPGEYELQFAYDETNPVSVEFKTQLVKALEAAGFKVRPFPTVNAHDLYRLVSDSHAPVNLRQGGWCPDWPSADEEIPPQFQTDGGGATRRTSLSRSSTRRSSGSAGCRSRSSPLPGEPWTSRS